MALSPEVKAAYAERQRQSLQTWYGYSHTVAGAEEVPAQVLVTRQAVSRLSIKDCPRFRMTDRAAELQRLTWLDFQNCGELDISPALAGLRRLETVHVSGTHVRDLAPILAA